MEASRANFCMDYINLMSDYAPKYPPSQPAVTGSEHMVARWAHTTAPKPEFADAYVPPKEGEMSRRNSVLARCSASACR